MKNLLLLFLVIFSFSLFSQDIHLANSLQLANSFKQPGYTSNFSKQLMIDQKQVNILKNALSMNKQIRFRTGVDIGLNGAGYSGSLGTGDGFLLSGKIHASIVEENQNYITLAIGGYFSPVSKALPSGQMIPIGNITGVIFEVQTPMLFEGIQIVGGYKISQINITNNDFLYLNNPDYHNTNLTAPYIGTILSFGPNVFGPINQKKLNEFFALNINFGIGPKNNRFSYLDFGLLVRI